MTKEIWKVDNEACNIIEYLANLEYSHTFKICPKAK